MKDIQETLRHKDIQTTANMYLNGDLESKKVIIKSIAKGLLGTGS